MATVKKSKSSKVTTDHEVIERWVEERGGHPARVKRTGTHRDGRTGGLLRIDFGRPEESLEKISWDEFFEAFEDNDLAFLYQDKIEGGPSRFFKFVARENVTELDEARLAADDAAEKKKKEGESGEKEKEEEEEDGDDDDDDDEEEDEEFKATENAREEEQAEHEEEYGSGEAKE